MKLGYSSIIHCLSANLTLLSVYIHFENLDCFTVSLLVFFLNNKAPIMINVNISQDKQAIKSYTWLHVDTFLDYCTIAA